MVCETCGVDVPGTPDPTYHQDYPFPHAVWVDDDFGTSIRFAFRIPVRDTVSPERCVVVPVSQIRSRPTGREPGILVVSLWLARVRGWAPWKVEEPTEGRT